MKNIDTLLLLGLPASGKSEVRRLLEYMDPAERLERYRIGRLVHLDDYPYVHLLNRVDEHLIDLGYQPLFFLGANRPLQDAITWLVYIHLLNEEYRDITEGRELERVDVVTGFLRLFDRISDAYLHFGMLPPKPPEKAAGSLARKLGGELLGHWRRVNENVRRGREGATVLVEFSRGGPHGSPMPIIPPRGYESSLRELSADILKHAGILYVEVSAAQSFGKNRARGLPNAQGSILHHSVPDEVMRADYGCDDMKVIAQGRSGGKLPGVLHAATVERVALDPDGVHGRLEQFKLPVGIMHNMPDRTSFARSPTESWNPDDVARLHHALEEGVNRCISAAEYGVGQNILV